MTETSQASGQASNSGKWVERFGTIKSIVARTDKNGKAYATFTIAAPKFNQNGIAFGETAEKIIATAEGTRVWAKGPIAYKTVQVNGEDKQVGDFTAIYFNISTPKAETETPAVEAEVVADAAPVVVERKKSRRKAKAAEAVVVEADADNAFA